MNRDGKWDQTFGYNGIAPVQRTISIPGDAILLPDGKVLQVHTTSTTQSSILVSKQQATGEPDTGFGQNGIKIVEFAGHAYGTSIAVQVDGKVAVGGFIESSVVDFVVFRLTNNGEMDSTFGISGVVTLDFSPAGSNLISQDRLWSLLAQADGKIIAAGVSAQFLTSPGRTEEYSVLARLNSDGSPDKSFGTGGVSMELIGSGQINYYYGRAQKAKFQQDGKILAGASTEQEVVNSPGNYIRKAVVLRYNPNGVLDPEFSEDGITDISGPSASFFGTLEQLSDGKILILYSDGLLRLNSDGSRDPTFGNAGLISFLSAGWNPSAFIITSNNKIIVSGSATRSLQPGTRFFARLQRYWPDGTPDIRFGQGGKTIVDLGNQNLHLAIIGTQQDKYLIAAGVLNVTGLYPTPVTARFFATRKL